MDYRSGPDKSVEILTSQVDSFVATLIKIADRSNKEGELENLVLNEISRVYKGEPTKKKKLLIAAAQNVDRQVMRLRSSPLTRSKILLRKLEVVARLLHERIKKMAAWSVGKK